MTMTIATMTTSTVAAPGAASVAASVTMQIDGSCTACGLCVITCPDEALLPSPKRPTFVATRCSSCQACLEVCPRDALTLGPGR